MGSERIGKGATSDLEDALTSADQDVADLIACVGERVRAARLAQGLPRRVLSEMSGVSPRYLAQLESGEGNISIGLLMRVAQALELQMPWLVAPGSQDLMRAQRVADLFQAADAVTQQAVLARLQSTPVRDARQHRICLIGLRGAGKSTLGAMIGKALEVPFVEMNREIEDRAGMPIGEVMALYGPEGYRALEADALDAMIASHSRMVLAVAGGIVGQEQTFDRVLGNFHTIWLQATPEAHMARVRAQGDERPMAGHPQAMVQLRNILKRREGLYARAHARLNTSEAPLEDTVQRLLSLITREKYLA